MLARTHLSQSHLLSRPESKSKSSDFLTRPFVRFQKTIIDYQLSRKAKSLIKQLDKWEEIPIRFNPCYPVYQSADFAGVLSKAKELRNRMCKSASAQTAKRLNDLARRIIGLQYRLEKRNGGIDKEANGVLDQDLYKAAAAWRKENKLKYTSIFTEQDKQKLLEASRYPEFVKLILTDGHLRRRFFEWILPNSNKHQPFAGNSVQTFIEFPSHAELIHGSLLQSRSQRFGGNPIRVIKTCLSSGSSIKDLTIDLERGQSVSLLNKKRKIKFIGEHGKGHLVITVRKMLKVFKNKKKKYGHLEMLNGRVTLWNAMLLGEYDSRIRKMYHPDFSKKDWYKEQPPQEILSKEEASKRYSSDCNGKNCIITYKASRSFIHPDLTGNHAYFEVAIPREDGCYEIRTYGRIARQFPVKMSDFMAVVAQPYEDALASPDENFVYAKRQHTGHSEVVNKEKLLEFMDLIRHRILKCRLKRKKFQLLYNNCVRWVEKTGHKFFGKEKTPDFRINFWDLQPSGTVGKLFRFTRQQSSPWRERLASAFFFALGSWKKHSYKTSKGRKKEICLANNKPWSKGGFFYYPPKLFEKTNF